MKTQVKLDRAVLKIEEDIKIINNEYSSFDQIKRAKARIKRNENKVEMWKEWINFFDTTTKKKTFEELLTSSYNELQWQMMD